MKLNFETMYYAAVETSCELAEKYGPYSTYEGSPMPQGIFQPDMWGITPSDRWDWAALRAKVAKHGVRNSLLLAPMPTASTAQVFITCLPIQKLTLSTVYVEHVQPSRLGGEFTVANKVTIL
jgi:ribonucleotide reductase alpha subunit